MLVAPLLLELGCGKSDTKADGEPAPSAASAAAPADPNLGSLSHTAPLSTLVVDHGELDTKAPPSSPRLAATTVATTVYKLPNTDSRRLGYIRIGGSVERDVELVKGAGCKAGFHRVYPMGYVCLDDATTDLEAPLVRAASRRPDTNSALPYKYGFVRATAPQYLRIPTAAEQRKSEFKLDEHLDWYQQNRDEVQRVDLGSNDIVLDARGIPRPGLKKPEGFRPSPDLSINESLGGSGPDDPPPFWLADGKRSIPNISGFQVPEYAIFADRVRRKTGLSFVGAFNTVQEDITRRFGVTVDLRLIPTTKVKPDSGSTFHGVELNEKFPVPFCWVIRRDSKLYQLVRNQDQVRVVEDVPHRAIVPLSGTARIKAGKRYYQTKRDKTLWLRAEDIGIVASPPEWPEVAEKGEKWIDVSLRQQTLVLYEGKRPWYATLVSTGRDRFGDPKTSMGTPQGTFRLQSKHIAAAMDSEENSTVAGGTRANTNSSIGPQARATMDRLLQAEKDGKKLDTEDQRRLVNIKKGRHPEYGVTMRRGAAGFELRDVPWIQYFSAGYALHGAYWHDVFGVPRSHGCINLAPIDARIAFMWTDPPVPEGWHGMNIGADMGQGTTIVIHE